jgi:hypothetical protein
LVEFRRGKRIVAPVDSRNIVERDSCPIIHESVIDISS